MRSSLIPAIVLTSAVYAAPAMAAAPAYLTFRDVPRGHWAEQAVITTAIEHKFLRPFAGGVFRGDAPFTRLQLAVAMDALIQELEAGSKRSWERESLGGYRFHDLAGASAEERAVAERLANRYGLFEGVPGVTARTLEAERQVSRYELAKVVHRLIKLGEAKGAVRPRPLAGSLAFTDVDASAWARPEALALANRYQVVAGFPDGTFRGPEELTRYQFAATAAQTFPLVTALVDDAQRPASEPAEEALSMYRFMALTPLQLGVVARGNGPVGPAGFGRGLGYFGDWFGLAEAEVATPLATGDRLYGGSLNLGYAFSLGSAFALQPYVGGRVLGLTPGVLGGLNYGVIAYTRPAEALGFWVNATGTSPLGATAGSPMGSFLGGASVGGEYALSRNLALFLEGGYKQLPTSLAPGLGADGAAVGSLGVGLGF